jgi:hypothetical protein
MTVTESGVSCGSVLLFLFSQLGQGDFVSFHQYGDVVRQTQRKNLGLRLGSIKDVASNAEMHHAIRGPACSACATGGAGPPALSRTGCRTRKF